MTSALTDETILAAIRDRRAVRAYRPEPVPEATIRQLLEAAVLAPTAMHLEPWAFVVVQDRARLARYSTLAKSHLLQQAAAHPSSGAMLRQLENPAFNIFYDAGTLIVICARPLGGFVVADCWLAAENLMLAATGMGLGTCCIGLAIPVLDTPEVKQELGIPAEFQVVAPIIVGQPSGTTPPVPRKPPVVLSWIR